MTFLNGSDRTGLADGDKRELRCGTVNNAFPHGRQPKYDIEATYISPFQVRCDLPMGLTCGGSSAAKAFRLLEERSQPHVFAHYRLCSRAQRANSSPRLVHANNNTCKCHAHAGSRTLTTQQARLAAREKLAIAHPRKQAHAHRQSCTRGFTRKCARTTHIDCMVFPVGASFR